MGLNFSQILFSEDDEVCDCSMYGYKYVVKGTYYSMICFLFFIDSEIVDLWSRTFWKKFAV